MVIWLLGISGSGKSTLGKKLHEYFEMKNKKSFIIDGDLVREFYNNDLGYTKKDRITNIKRIMLSAYILEQSGIIPIICNISPFQFLRDFARDKFEDYNEIYLSKSIQKAKHDDVKCIYKNNLNRTDIVGIDLEFEKPINSDLILNTDLETVEESFEKILNYISRK